MNYEKYLTRWLPVLIYMALIFYGSSITSTKLPGPEGIDLSPLHVPEYAGLGYLIATVLTNDSMKLKKAISLSMIICFLYGITDEIHQIFVPGRAFDLIDMSFNLIGGIIGSNLILFKIWLNSK